MNRRYYCDYDVLAAGSQLHCFPGSHDHLQLTLGPYPHHMHSGSQEAGWPIRDRVCSAGTSSTAAQASSMQDPAGGRNGPERAEHLVYRAELEGHRAPTLRGRASSLLDLSPGVELLKRTRRIRHRLPTRLRVCVVDGVPSPLPDDHTSVVRMILTD
jgi:hypothetical protein